VKAQILENLVKGHVGFGLFIRLVFTRVLKVIALCLTLTLIVWLVWLGRFTLGAFLGGVAVGLSVFLIMSSLKRRRGYQEEKESSEPTAELENLTGSEEILPKTSVED
jgi:hypothetical protein